MSQIVKSEMLLDERKIFLVGGPGGVGKTTLAATWGLSLARRGYRTVVLTVDPARRLAQALGLESLGSELQRIPLVPHAGSREPGELFASMLNSKQYFDRLIERIATTPQQRDRILSNRLYRIMVDQLGGSHEYAAMERLLEFASDPQYDRVVIDTPPADNAIELFRAPQRMAAFMDHSVLKWFQGGGKLYSRLFRTGTRLAMRVLQQVFGSDFLEELGAFLSELEGMQEGFQRRHEEVLSLLAGPQTSFLVVSDASETRFRQVEQLLPVLNERKIQIDRLWVNFIEPAVPEVAPTELGALHDYYANIRKEQLHWLNRLNSLGLEAVTKQIPRRPSAPHDIQALTELSDLLAT